MVLKGKRDLLEKLQADEELCKNESMKQGMADLDTLFTLLEYFDAMHTVSFDLSLARGMSLLLPHRIELFVADLSI